MTQLRKDQPGSAPGGYTWEGPDDVVDVPPDLAHELLRQPDGGFHEVFDTDTDAGAAAAEQEAKETAEREAAAKEAQETERPKIPTHKADLQALARELELSDEGTVPELTARIEAHYAAKTPITEPDPNAHS